MQNIPENVVAAAVGLLSPFVSNLTAEALLKKLSAGEGEQNKLTRTEYTRQEASKRLGLSLRTVDDYMATGLLEARKIGRKRVLISPESVEALLTGKTRREVTA